MIYTKNKMLSKITVFIVILTLLCWIVPSVLFGNSEKDLKEAYEKALITLETGQDEVTKAESDLELAKQIAAEAEVNLEAAREKLNVRNENFASASPEVKKLKEKLIFAQVAADEANSFYERIKETGSEEEINTAKEVAEKANAELELISKEYNDANSNLMALQNELNEAKAEFEELKSAADEANANLLYAEKVLNEKNENLNIAQAEVERTKAELEAYLAEIAEKETVIEEGASDGEDTGEEILEESTDEEIIEEEVTPTEEDIAEEDTTPLEEEQTEEITQSEEVTAEEDTTSGEEEVGEEVVSEESVNVEVTDEGNVPEEGIEEENTDENLTEGATSDEGVSEEEIIGEETLPEDELAEVEAVEEDAIEGEIVEVTSELVLEDEAVYEEVVVEESSELKIDILFSTDENGYIPAGEVTAFIAAVEGIVPFQYFWDFGNGSSSSQQNPQYAYSNDGNYTLSLTILDTDGNAYSKSVTVNVSDYNPDTTEYWISTDASDEGTGTIEDPITIDAALSHTVNGDTLYFLPGTYNTSVNLDGIGTGTEGLSAETETGIEEIPAETEDETETEDLSIKFIAYDDVVFDGQSTLDYAFYYSSPLSYLGFYNFTFLNYIDSAIYIDNEDVTNINIVDNIFSGNGTAIDITMDSNLNIQNNIIVDNDAGVVISSDDANIEHNIIAFNQEGIVVDDTRDNITVDYNDVFGNETDYQGVEPGENDISVDPEFTDKDNLDFSIPDDSPLYENKIIRVTSTDKDDYTYGEQVIISGKGYDPYQDLIIKIVRPDGSMVKEIFITTDENGSFVYDEYYIDFAGRYFLLQVLDQNRNILSTINTNTIEVLSFTDTIYVNIYIQNVPVDPGYIDSSDNLVSTDPFYGTDNGGLSDPVVWHFVLNKLRHGTPPGVITAVFNIGGTEVTYTGPDYSDPSNTPNMKNRVAGNGQLQHFYVGTASDYKLLSATFATVEKPQDTGNQSPSLVLSHIVHNTPGTGSITVIKTGLEGSDTAIFKLYWVDPTGDLLVGTITFDNATNDPSSDSWLNLEYGTYRIEESYPASGNVYTYTTDLDATAKYDINAGNPSETVEVVNEAEGSVTVNKSGLLDGDTADFELFLVDPAGGPDQTQGKKTVSSADTTKSWTGLEQGDYYVVETPPAIGYSGISWEIKSGVTLLDSGTGSRMPETGEFTIDGSQLDITINVVNEAEGEITLKKTGLSAGDTAGFTLYNSAGAAVGIEKRVIGNGSVNWSNLPWDTYTIRETTTPSGYNTMADITGIVVGATQQSYSFNRTNTKIPPPPVIEVLGIAELPFTGMNPIIPISGILSMFAGVILLVISVSRRRRKEI